MIPRVNPTPQFSRVGPLVYGLPREIGMTAALARWITRLSERAAGRATTRATSPRSWLRFSAWPTDVPAKEITVNIRPFRDEDLEHLRAGEPSGLESVVTFLEADPIFHGTGYLKEHLCRRMKGLDIPKNYLQRLQAVILSIVNHRDGREFRSYCHLARKVDSPEFREQLTRRLTHDDPNVRRRAR